MTNAQQRKQNRGAPADRQQQPVSPALVAAVRPENEINLSEEDLLDLVASGEASAEEVMALGALMDRSAVLEGVPPSQASDSTTNSTMVALKEQGADDEAIAAVLADERVQTALADAERAKAEADAKYQTAQERKGSRHGKHRGSDEAVSSDALFDVLDAIGAGVEGLAELGDWQLMAAMVGIDLASGGIAKTVLKQLGLIDRLAKGAGVDLDKLTAELSERVLAFAKGTDLAGLKKMDPTKLARARLGITALVSSMVLGTKKAAKRIKSMSARSKKGSGKLDSGKSGGLQRKPENLDNLPLESRQRSLSGWKRNQPKAPAADYVEETADDVIEGAAGVVGLGPKVSMAMSGLASTGLEAGALYREGRLDWTPETAFRLALAGSLGLWGGHKANQIAKKYNSDTWGDFWKRAGANAIVGGNTGAIGNAGSANISGFFDGKIPSPLETAGHFLKGYRGGFLAGGLGSAGGDSIRTGGNFVRNRLRPNRTDTEIVDDMIDFSNGLPEHYPVRPPAAPSKSVEVLSDLFTQAGQGGAVVAGNSGSLIGEGLGKIGYFPESAGKPRQNYDLGNAPRDVGEAWRFRFHRLCQQYPGYCD